MLLQSFPFDHLISWSEALFNSTMRFLESPILLPCSSSSNGRNRYNNCDKWFYDYNLHKIEWKCFLRHGIHLIQCRIYYKPVIVLFRFLKQIVRVVFVPMFHFNAHICVSLRVRILYFHDVYKSISQWKMPGHLFWIFRVHKIQFTAVEKCGVSCTKNAEVNFRRVYRAQEIKAKWNNDRLINVHTVNGTTEWV